ncbi:MAG: flagellar motor protein MotB [Alphaproteobacteria bacterium]|nr:flagellar motor protein MotB [Alphaproteobacteria bacterium]
MIDTRPLRKDDDGVEPAPPWLISMGDVTALMLTFFVMLFSMSHLKSERWDEIISLINTSIEPSRIEEPPPASDQNISTIVVLGGLSTDYLNRILVEKLDRDPILRQARLTALQEQVSVSLPSDLLFEAGGDTLAPGAFEAISRLSGVMAQIGNHVDIVGHTDPTPARSEIFKTNWELSLGQALKVAETVRQAGYQGDFSAFGMGDSRYRHIDRRLPEEERYALARRIDIVFRAEAGGQ